MKKSLLYIIALLSFAVAACDKQDDTYRQYVVNGGYNYPAKPLEVKTKSGYLRVELSWAVPQDPAVKSVKVYWDNYAKSAEVDYKTAVDGRVSTMVTNLEDRAYTFNIVNYDGDGNRSLSAEVTVSPYGDGWLSTHAERKVVKARMSGTDASIVMGNPMDEMVATKFRYKNTLGEWVEIQDPLPSSEFEVTFPDALKGKLFEYKSAYCPLGGIDTVWNSNWTKSGKVIDYLLSAESWTGTYTANQMYTGTGDYGVKQLFDGITDVPNNGYRANTATTYRNIFPKIISIDTNVDEGKEFMISHVELYQHPTTTSYRYVRNMSLFAGNQPFDPNDKDYATSYGEPILAGAFTTSSAKQGADVDKASAGRYLAVAFLNSWSANGYIWVQELELWGYIPSEID